MLDLANVVVAGGMESMSNTPYYLTKARWGAKYGHQEMLDGITKDGLTDAYDNTLMGNAAELCAKNHGFSREDQDDFAISSYQRAQEATNNGWFDDEIVPVEVAQGRGKPSLVVKADEEVKNVRGGIPLYPQLTYLCV